MIDLISKTSIPLIVGGGIVDSELIRHTILELTWWL
jgi:hypothetical protein